MAELDYALLCDYARAEGGVAHVIAAGIDTIQRSEVPSVANPGLLARTIFDDDETGETHQVEVQLRDQEGEQIAQVNLTVVPRRIEGLPEGWPTGALLAMNFGVPLPSFGPYTPTILLNDTPKKTLNLRVVPPEVTSGPAG
jgi:hypothetical protein